MDDKGPQRNLLRYATVGIEFLLVFLLFLTAGWLLDKRIGTSPGFTGLGGILGFGIAFYRLTKQGWGIMKTHRRDEAEGGDSDDPA